MEYSGNLHSAVDKLGRYLQGKYIYSGPGSVVDVLTQYYILAYQGGGKTEEEARAAAAQSTQDMIVYLYYAYVMGAYYEQAIALYQTAYITENGRPLSDGFRHDDLAEADRRDRHRSLERRRADGGAAFWATCARIIIRTWPLRSSTRRRAAGC